MTDREMKTHQQDILFEKTLAQELLERKLYDKFQEYLDITIASAVNGMNKDEVDAVRKRAREAAKRYENAK